MILFLIKKTRNHLLIIFVLGLVSIACNQKKDLVPLFQLIDAGHTNIDFENTLFPSDSLNILNFEYMFNGAGVGIGDINNDGLPDVYFSGNQVSGKLYQNLGDFRFKDITVSANVSTKGWSNGVSLVDINQDGLLDIYICKGGSRNAKQHEMSNLAFINNGDGTFLEKAMQLGIADTGYSIQGVFFDYNNDGYNDLYVLTNALVSYNRNTSKPKMIHGESPTTDRLYKNNGDGTFSNVSDESGITIEGFGLGVGVSDINKDGWLDVYVSNDFLTNDILYINNGDGTFSNQIKKYIKHQSFNGMGMNISDINNDGHLDIVVLDMLPQDAKRHKQTIGNFSYDKHKHDIALGYTPQYVRNTLQLNNGNDSFSEIGQLSGIHSTDWSWAPLIADFDNDGFKDLFITNGYRRDVTNLDFIVYGKQASSFGNKATKQKNKLQKLQELPEVKLPNYVYKNNGDLTFTDKTKDWGVTLPSYSNGAAYADLDNDGDLDLVINNIDDKAHIYKNTLNDSLNISNEEQTHFLKIQLKGKSNPIGTQIVLDAGGVKQHQLFSPVTGYLSTMDNSIHFGLGDVNHIDSLKVIWPNGNIEIQKNIKFDQLLVLDYKNAIQPSRNNETKKTALFTTMDSDTGINYMHKEDSYVDFKSQATLLHMNSKLGSGIAVGDINGDGLEDFFVGAAAGSHGSFFVQQPNSTFVEQKLNDVEVFDTMGTLLLDVDGDTDLDLLLVSGGNNPYKKDTPYLDHLYKNDGKGNFEKEVFFRRNESGSCIKAADFDKDGDLDLFIGGRFIDGSYPLSPKSYMLINENGHFIEAKKQVFDKAVLGMVSDAIWTDFDNDQWVDLIVVGEYMSPQFYKNDKGRFTNVSSSTGLVNASGWWNSIAAGDFDRDGDIDYLLGNLGKNTIHKASVKAPITLYAKDFDGNGAIDPLVSAYSNGEEYLIHARDLLINQINAMKRRFKTYESYAKTSFDKTFMNEELEDALVLKAELLTSSYMENLGKGKFSIKELPRQAQFAPVFGMEVQDYNNDGNLDVLLIGNYFGTDALRGQYDAMNGLCLLGDGKGEFRQMSAIESGLKIDGDAKGIVQLQLDNGNQAILVSQNSGPLKAYTYKTASESILINVNEAYAKVYDDNGGYYKVQFNYGSSYLSNSSRRLSVNWDRIAYIEIYTYMNQMRKIERKDD